MKTKGNWIDNYESYPPLTRMDGYDDCAIGVLERIGTPNIVVYDKTKVLKKTDEGWLHRVRGH